MEFGEYEYTGRITPLEAQKMPNDEGMNVTLEEATEILKFLAKMADVTVRKFFKRNKKIYNQFRFCSNRF
ncbi:hypothetical protein GON26_01640 [Flavobacterium sp. GA093]|uniref:Uncharacterized protein n=1 Tax=Flavobacterium hydrocarbonoxydans TaxID=2683249 RepID=A0A6I4NFZ9_9FLAO|nr:hypothetical protein [Flavobacterium hydrocarbonoxydans]MWB93051.1 hypothetical protein [Flavobacterium hydrocarbonoxydans]